MMMMMVMMMMIVIMIRHKLWKIKIQDDKRYKNNSIQEKGNYKDCCCDWVVKMKIKMKTKLLRECQRMKLKM